MQPSKRPSFLIVLWMDNPSLSSISQQLVWISSRHEFLDVESSITWTLLSMSARARCPANKRLLRKTERASDRVIDAGTDTDIDHSVLQEQRRRETKSKLWPFRLLIHSLMPFIRTQRSFDYFIIIILLDLSKAKISS